MPEETLSVSVMLVVFNAYILLNLDWSHFLANSESLRDATGGAGGAGGAQR